ncbi:MAG: hypothetical protein ACKOAD_06895 [Gammaproteobacteria bacterium]
MAIEDRFVATYRIANEIPELKSNLVLVEKPLVENLLYVTINKSVPKAAEIIKAFNTSLQKMKQDGSYQAVLTQHGF